MGFRDSQRFRKIYSYYRPPPKNVEQIDVVDTFNGLDWKQSVRLATDGNINLAGTFSNKTDIDTGAGAGALVDEDRILVKSQTNQAENGIYIWYESSPGSGVGTLNRTNDATQDSLTSGATCYVEDGTYEGQVWTLVTKDPITVGTTNQTWTQIAGTGFSSGGGDAYFSSSYAGSIYTSGSAAFVGDGDEFNVISSSYQKGVDVFFYVSGSKDGSYKSLFGGDVVVSGTLTGFSGLSGSLTTLADGTTPYLMAGPNITINTSSNGQVSITGSAGGGDSYFSSSYAGSIFTTGSAAFRGQENISSSYQKGSDVFFYVSGSISGSGANDRRALFGGDVRISGSLSQGFDTLASGLYSHAEGERTRASGQSSHAEGERNIASAYGSHAEGYQTLAANWNSHAEGYITTAGADYSHAEGFRTTTAGGAASHAEGSYTTAYGGGSHAEGRFTTANGNYSHAEGSYTKAAAESSHAEGYESTGSVSFSHAEGYSSLSGARVFAVLFGVSPGSNAIFDLYGYSNVTGSFGVGSELIIATDAPAVSVETAIIVGKNYDSINDSTHVTASYYSYDSSGNGYQNFIFDITKPFETVASAVEDLSTTFSFYSHTEGYDTFTFGRGSHAEGRQTKALGEFSHAEGYNAKTVGNYSHAEGSNTVALGLVSHAEGQDTIASGSYQHVQGKYNKRDNSSSLFVIGDGTGDSNSLRSDIVRVNPGALGGQGSLQLTGSLYVSGTATFDPQGRSVANVGSDVYFFVSGSSGSLGTSTRGVAAFGGDVIVSGSLKVGTGSVTITSNDVQFGGASTRIEKSSTDLKFYDGANPSGVTLSSLAAGTGVASYWTSPSTNLVNTTGSVSIQGDLTVNGTTVTVNTTNLEVKDSVIGLGFSSGTIAQTAGDRGIIAGLAGADNAAFLWKNASSEFAVGRTTASATGSLPVTISSYSDFRAATVRASGLQVTGSLYASGSSTFDPQGRSTSQIGSDVFFFVSGSLNGANKSVFGGDVRVSGSLNTNLLTGTNGNITNLVTTQATSSYFTVTNEFVLATSVLEITGNLYVTQAVSSSFVTGTYVLAQDVRSTRLSGSLTRLADGTSYLVAGNNITITSQSNGSVLIAATGGVTDDFFDSTVSGKVYSTGSFAFRGAESIFNPATKGTDVFFYVSGSLSGADKSLFGGFVTVSGTMSASTGRFSQLTSSFFNVTDSFISSADQLELTGTLIVTGSARITGSLAATGGLSGSLTKLVDGTSYLIAGTNVTITSASNGAVTISSTGGGTADDFFDSTVSGKVFTTGSFAFRGSESVNDPATKGTDVFFYVSGSISGSGAANKKSLFGGDVVISGSFAQGLNVIASGTYAHAQGSGNTASGLASHAEGVNNTATGNYSHAEGTTNVVSGLAAHAEGQFTLASGGSSHSEGLLTTGSGNFSHVEGNRTIASGESAHAEGYATLASNYQAHAEGYQTSATGENSHAEGYATLASGFGAHAEGLSTIANGNYSHANGEATLASGITSHAEGWLTTGSGNFSHSEGYKTIASGNGSHAEGESTTASGYASHAEGYQTAASLDYAHAEGYQTIASNYNSHAEGWLTLASGDTSHAEGYLTTASIDWAHAEGKNSHALGVGSHAEGFFTIASGSYQHVGGKYNKRGNDFSLFVIGDGTGDANANRSDILRINSGSTGGTGNIQVTGSLYVSGTAAFDSRGRATSNLGSDVFFFVSGSIAGTDTNDKKALFGGDVRVSGSLNTNFLTASNASITTLNATTVTASYLTGTYVLAQDVKSTSLTGSLTKLANGSSYLVAGNNITITSQSNGSILFDAIQPSTYWTSPSAGLINTTGSVSIQGDLTVNGTTVTVNTTNLEVKDAVIGLGFSSGTIAQTSGDRGIIAGLAGSDNAAFLWDDSASEFSVGRTTSSATGSLPITFSTYSNFHAANIKANIVTASLGFSGSLTKLVDGSSYIVAGAGILITTQSNGSVLIASTGGGGGGGNSAYGLSFVNGDLTAGVLTVNHNLNSQYVSVTVFDDTDVQIIPDNVTATSTTSLDVDLTSFGALSNTWHLTVLASGSTGIGGGDSFFSSTTAGSIFTTGSAAFRGGLSSVDSPSDLGADVFFFVSGSTAGSGANDKKVLFGGDIKTSGSYLLNVVSGTTSPTYNVNPSDHFVVFTANNVTGVLPPTALVGTQITFKDGTGNAGTAGGQMLSSSAGRIDGAATHTMPSINYTSVTIIKVRTSPEEWLIM